MRKITFGLAAMAMVASASAVQLYDNGPLVTNPGAGLGGGDASAIETGNNIYGFGCRLAAGVIVADDFTVPTGHTWTLSDMKVWTYQTFATTPTVNTFYVQIWNGRPGDTGSAVVAGDRTTNRASSVVFTNIYRVIPTALTNGDRHVQEATINMSWVPPLAAGTYWVEYSTEGNVSFSGPWIPPVTPHRASDNGIQSVDAGATWAVLDGNTVSPPPDIQPQDLNFRLNGTDAGGSTVLTNTSTSLAPGIVISGTPADMNTSNDVYYTLRPGVVISSAQSPIVLVISYTAPGSTASALSATYEARAQQANIRQTLDAYNFSTATYDQLDQQVLPTSTPDTVINPTISSPNNHIGPGNEIRLRVSYKAVGPILSYPWRVFIDQAVVNYTP